METESKRFPLRLPRNKRYRKSIRLAWGLVLAPGLKTVPIVEIAMTPPRTALLAAGLAAISLPALAGPYGDARVLPVHAEAIERHGYQLGKPDLLATAAGIRAHGVICRQAGHVGAPARRVQLQHLDPAGRVLAAVQVRVDFDSLRRSASCSAYDLATAWTLDAGDTVRATAL